MTTTTVNLKSNTIRPMMSTESTLTDQSHSIPNSHLDCPHVEISPSQHEKTPLNHQQQLPTNQNRYLPSSRHVPGHHQQRKTTTDNPIVNINLDLRDESASDDEDNSLPKLFIKRVIVPDSSSPGCDLVNTNRTDKTLPNRHRRARNREQSKVHHFRSHTSKR